MPLLILQHGFTGNMEERHIRAVAEAVNGIGFACLRTELYGHGGSDGAFRDHTVGKWVEEMLTVIDYAGALDFTDGLYLAGHSQGGLTAMLAAAMKHDVLRGLLPLAPATVIREDALAGRLFGVHYDPDCIPETVQVPWKGELGGNYFRVAQLLPIETAIDRFKGPVLIVHADTDESVPVSYAEAAAERYANAELKIIRGDTHCYDRHLPEVTAAVTEFLQRIEKNART